MKISHSKFAKFSLAAVALSTLGACALGEAFRSETADRVAGPAWMLKREIAAMPFALTAYERIHERQATANIYIEGDGSLKSDFTRLLYIAGDKSLKTDIGKNLAITPNDATPKNPLALRLAAQDKSENVIYLARPCQYSGLLDSQKPCNSRYLKDERFSPEVLNAYGAALDDIKRRYDIRGFNLVGFSGGGAIAALLSAGRDDVLSLRTVAGTLDHFAYTMHYGLEPLNNSLNPIDFSDQLKNIPQYHFIGGQDLTMPPAVLHSYLQNLGDTNCVQYQMVQEAEHFNGWDQKWPELLARGTTCRGAVKPVEFIEPLPEPAYVPRDIPAKP